MGRWGDGEMGRQGDKGTRGQGEGKLINHPLPITNYQLTITTYLPNIRQFSLLHQVYPCVVRRLWQLDVIYRG